MINSWMFSKVLWVCLWWFAELGFVIFSLISVVYIDIYENLEKGYITIALKRDADKSGLSWMPDVRCGASIFCSHSKISDFHKIFLWMFFIILSWECFLCHIKADHLIDRFMGCVMMGRSGLTNFLNKMARFWKVAFLIKDYFLWKLPKVT